jgi:hypothetical protein
MTEKTNELSFVQSLNKEQIEYALKVRQAAEDAGVNPKLALAIAYQESRFNPKAPRGSSGEVGLMQIKPSTAAELGFTMKDILDPDKNIQAGIAYLKQALDVTGNDIRLAPIYYNGGPGTFGKFARGEDYDKRVDKYLSDLSSYNTFKGFDESKLTEPQAAVSTPVPKVEVKDPLDKKFEEEGQKELTRQEFGMYGAGAGTAGAAVTAGLPVVTNTTAKVIGNILGQVQEAKNQRMGAPTGAPPTTGAPPSAATVTPPPAASGALPTGGEPTSPRVAAPATVGGLGGQPPMGPADGGRMAAGQTGVIPYNTAKALGLTDIEAGRALTNTKQEGGAWNLAEKRAESTNKLQSLFPGERYTENPRFGGVLTLDQSVGKGPRESFVVRPEIPANPDLPEGRPAQLASIPKAPVISTVVPPPPPPSGLEQVKNMFGNMMQQTSRALPYVAAPLAGYSLGRDVADLYMGYMDAPDNRDFVDLGLTGLSALGTIGAYTPAAPLAIPAAIVAPTIRNVRRRLIEESQKPEEQEFLKRELTAKEIEEASRPAFRYAKPMGQRPTMIGPRLQPRVPEMGTNLPPVESIRN